MNVEQLKAHLREAVANYMKSEGCSCCQDYQKHIEDEAKLGELLDVPMYSDGSGYNFGIFIDKSDDLI